MNILRFFIHFIILNSKYHIHIYIYYYYYYYYLLFTILFYEFYAFDDGPSILQSSSVSYKLPKNTTPNQTCFWGRPWGPINQFGLGRSCGEALLIEAFPKTGKTTNPMRPIISIFFGMFSGQMSIVGNGLSGDCSLSNHDQMVLVCCQMVEKTCPKL